MRAIVILLTAAVLAVNARPDVSLGYQYNTAKDLYAGATPNHDAVHQASAEHSYYGGDGGHQNTASTADYTSGTAVYQTTGVQHQHQQDYVGATVATGAGANGQYYSGAASGSGNSVVASTGYTSSSSSSSGISSHSSATATGAVQPSQLPPIITKSFYFEAAPEEPEEKQAPRFVSVGRAQKNYKVIFIKAPSYGLNSQIIPVLPQNEEKTIIYVLSKKPELNQDIELPQVPVTEPTKPEIFFVKYKSEQEALDAQHKIKHVYETNQPSGAEGEAHFDDGHIHSIVSDAVPNVYSASSPLGGHRQHHKQQVIGAVLGQRFGEEEDEVQDQRVNSAELVPVTGIVDAGGALEEQNSGADGGFKIVTQVVENNAAGEHAHQFVNESGEPINVNFLDLNNNAEIQAAIAAATAGGESLTIAGVTGVNEPLQEYLVPNHEHEQNHEN